MAPVPRAPTRTSWSEAPPGQRAARPLLFLALAGSACGRYSVSAISGGHHHYCVLTERGRVRCRVYEASLPMGEEQAPSGTGWRQVAAGAYAGCALDADGELHCWGNPDLGLTDDPPKGPFVHVSTGYSHACALDAQGEIACWGLDFEGETTAPDGPFRAVSAGYAFNCGLRTDGTVTCWGWDDYGQTGAPEGAFVSISAGAVSNHACALSADHRATCWGADNVGQSTPPDRSDLIALALGYRHTCALTDQGEVVCWGSNEHGQLGAPAEKFVMIRAGFSSTCGLTAEGLVVCWGCRKIVDEPDQCRPPE